MKLLRVRNSIVKNSYAMGLKSFKYILEMPNDNLILQEQEILAELLLLHKHVMEKQTIIREWSVLKTPFFFFSITCIIMTYYCEVLRER